MSLLREAHGWSFWTKWWNGNSQNTTVGGKKKGFCRLVSGVWCLTFWASLLFSRGRLWPQCSSSGSTWVLRRTRVQRRSRSTLTKWPQKRLQCCSSWSIWWTITGTQPCITACPTPTSASLNSSWTRVSDNQIQNKSFHYNILRSFWLKFVTFFFFFCVSLLKLETFSITVTVVHHIHLLQVIFWDRYTFVMSSLIGFHTQSSTQ